MENKIFQKKINIFWFLLLLFIIFRLAILLTSIDKLYDFEELYRGAIAKDILEGLSIPFFDYSYTEYEGGSLVIGILAAPFFYLFGQSYFSLKLATFLISILIFFLWYKFLEKAFGRSEAVLAGFLMTFSPPAYTKISLTSWGNHFESNLFTIAALSLFYKIFSSLNAEKNRKDCTLLETDKSRIFLHFILGTVAGFGIYFSYTFLITLIILLLIWFILDKKFLFKKSFIFFLSGFLIGFSPGIYFNLTHEFAGLRVKGVPLYKIFFTGSQTSGNAIHKFYDFFSSNLPNSYCFSDTGNIPGRLINYIYFFIFLLSYFALVWLNRKKILQTFSRLFSFKGIKGNYDETPIPSLFIIFFPLAFSLIYSLTPFKVGLKADDYFQYRYLMPLMQLEIVIIAVTLPMIMKHKIVGKFKSLLKPLSFFLLTILFLLGPVSNLRLISYKKPVNPFNYKGYNYFWLGQVAVDRYGFDLNNSLSLTWRIKKDYRTQYYEGLGYYYGWAFIANKDEGEKILGKINPALKSNFYKGLGVSYLFLHGENTKFEILKKFAAENIPPDEQKYFFIGYGKMMPYLEKKLKENFIGSADEDLRKYFYFGMGEGLGNKLGFNEWKCKNEIGKTDVYGEKYYLEGFSQGLKEAKFISG